MLKSIGTIIRERRKELGLKVYELAKKVDVHAVYITQIEKHNKLPSLKVMENIIRVLNLDPGIITSYLQEKDPEAFKQYFTSMENITKSIEAFSATMVPIQKALSAMKAISLDPAVSKSIAEAFKKFETASQALKTFESLKSKKP